MPFDRRDDQTILYVMQLIRKEFATKKELEAARFEGGGDNSGGDDSSGVDSPSELPVMSKTQLGCAKLGDNLKISEDGVLSVDTAGVVQQGNTKPITSAAVYTEVGNINALLETI